VDTPIAGNAIIPLNGGEDDAWPPEACRASSRRQSVGKLAMNARRLRDEGAGQTSLVTTCYL